MFLAPLNYDRFFKKIFSDKKIAKRFLEDFFEVKIQEIELISLDHKLTNEAHLVKFDFRCKIDGKYVIIDMQQWYKQDIVQRFYLYHTANTVLQLESLPTIQPDKEKRVKDYRNLLPVKTLIWLVDDSLKIKDDYSMHQMLPSELLDLVQADNNWTEANFSTLLGKRNAILNLLNNKTKNLPFLRNNQLIFAFQTNIVRNKKMKPYFKWFEFAQKTREENNEKKDFDIYTKDDIFAEMIRKLSHKSLEPEDFTFIEYYRMLDAQKDMFREEGEQVGLDKGKQLGLKEGEQIGYDKSKKETAMEMKKDGLPVEVISKYTGLTPTEIEGLD